MKMSIHRWVGLTLALLLAPPGLRAVEPVTAEVNPCADVGGQGDACMSDADCVDKAYATLCIKGIDGFACQIPCETGAEGVLNEMLPAECAVGETCREGQTPDRAAFYCEPTAFRVDLNLLDQCIAMYLEGQAPSFSEGDCSLQANLDRLMDQNGDHRFDIFDLDLCIVSFFEQPTCACAQSDDCSCCAPGGFRCDGPQGFACHPSEACACGDEGGEVCEPGQPCDCPGGWSCGWDTGCVFVEETEACDWSGPYDQICCRGDEDCGHGLYCDPMRHVCQRDCGVIASREEALEDFERPCAGDLKVCDYGRGRCVEIDPTTQSCDIDGDCPPGAYCFLGTCTPRCQRAVDCPAGEWYCDATNRCRALPHPDAEEGFVFEPRNYAIRFARDELQLDGLENEDRSELLIMDIATRRQVLGNPSVTFGYRLMVSYGLKQDAACMQPFVDCSVPETLPEGETTAACQARQDDCYIDDTEQWIRLMSPFGVISGAAQSGVAIELDEQVFGALTPGTYTATIRVVFDNGESDSVAVLLEKPALSGEYSGSLSVYMHAVENSLTGNRPLSLSMRMKLEDAWTNWDQLLTDNNLNEDKDLTDLTSGYLVRAVLHGDEAFAFTKGGYAQGYGSPDENEIPFVGLYSPDLGRLRLIGIIDIAEGFCISEEGDCDDPDNQIQVWNPFGRPIRRQIELIGPLDEAAGRFHGIYREKISGLMANGDLTLEGGFILDQQNTDDSAIDDPGPLLDVASGLAFPSLDDTVAQINRDIALYCGGEAASTDAAILDMWHDLAEEIEDEALETLDVCTQGMIISFFLDAFSGAEPPECIGKKYLDTCMADANDPEAFTACIDPYWNGNLFGLDLWRGEVFARDTSTWAWAQFVGQKTFRRYLSRAARRTPGEPSEYSVLGRTTIFPRLLAFGDIIETALGALAPGAGPEVIDPEEWARTDEQRARWQQDHLNIYDYLAARMLPCDPEDPAPPPVCVGMEDARCGLALYRKAIVKGWVWTDQIEGLGENDLYCPDTLELAGCPDEGAGAEDLFALQEHNRYWWNLGQALKFDGDRARSDAFLVLFRNAANPFMEQSALAYKSEHLRESVARYDELIHEIVGTPAAAVLDGWPARKFKQWGYDWLGVMQEVVDARMDAIAELVDLERRVFMGTDEDEFAFAQHMMQHEYLVHVYLMALQEEWQGDQFGYLGWAGPAFQKGQSVLNRLDPARNPLGLVPSRVYFENSNTSTSNWANYHKLLGGLIGAAQKTVAAGVKELKAALSDLDKLEASLNASKISLEDKLVSLCGRPVLGDIGDEPLMSQSAADADDLPYCQHLMNIVGLNGTGDELTEWEAIRDCVFAGGWAMENDYVHPPCEGLDISWECAGDSNGNCKDFRTTYVDATKDWNANGTAEPGGAETSDDTIYGDRCVIPKLSELHWVYVNGQPRSCIGGTMGGLLREKNKLELKRRINIRKVWEKLRRMQDELELVALQITGKAVYWVAHNIIVLIQKQLEFGVGLIGVLKDTIVVIGDKTKCLVIAGVAGGTNCPMSGVSAATVSATKATFGGTMLALKTISTVLASIDGLFKDALGLYLDALGIHYKALAKVRDVYALIDEFQIINQDLLSMAAKIDDVRYQAQVASDRYHKKVSFVADHLVGRESGNVLMGDQLVQEASEAFEEALLFAYKMTMAFIHHYNVASGEATNLVNQCLAATTLDDLQALADLLADRERDYCGMEAIDCDHATNVEVLRFSLREQLFGHLRDRVDPQTNTVITKGEQFHNLITSPPYVRRRQRGNQLVDQIELIYDIPVNLQENSSSSALPQWLLDPLSCNQMIDARDPSKSASYKTGSVAVNVMGRNLGAEDRRVRYELVRDAADMIRSCHPESVVEEVGTMPVLDYPIRTHVVGYAPQSLQAAQGEPTSFYTKSSPFTACMNEGEESGQIGANECWKFFARDRSLATTGSRIILPLRIGDGATDNTWILGEGLPDEARPIIEDIVIYYRYRARPIQED